MAIILPSGLKINAQEAVDNRILLSAEEMLNINIANIPKPYFCVCKDDNKVYIYNPDEEEDMDCDIGKFRPIERYLFNTETTKDFSDCKIDQDFTVTANVGGYKIGDQISATQTLKEILYTILGSDTPVVSEQLYFGFKETARGETWAPTDIDGNFSISIDVPDNFAVAGVEHTYNGTGGIAFAYPSKYGNLKHLYLGGDMTFDQLINTNSVTTTKDGIEYKIYYMQNRLVAENLLFEFLFNDKNN